MSLVEQRPTVEQVEAEVQALRNQFRALQTDAAKLAEGLSAYGSASELVERIRSELSDANQDLSRLLFVVQGEMAVKSAHPTERNL